MAEKKGKKEKNEFNVHFVKLASLIDLARYVCDFTPTLPPIYSFKEDGKYRFFSEGEKIDDTRLIYYTESDSTGRYGIYAPVNQSAKESFHVLDRYEKDDYKVYKFNIVEFLSRPYKEKDVKAGTIAYVRIKEPEPLVTALMSRGMSEEMMNKVYLFSHNGETFVGTFDLLGADDTRVFLFSKIEMKEPCGFFRYSYATDKLEGTNEPFESQYTYVRIINLAEPPTGFRPEGTKL
jgi:hypothetical protein